MSAKLSLNPQQHSAVTAGPGPLLVVAGAGTGKTRVLTRRVAHLLSLGVDPASICLLTFTQRAADEMLSRVLDLSSHPGVERIWSGTFHSVANRILRSHAERLGFSRDFLILDAEDARALMAQCVIADALPRSVLRDPATLIEICSRCVNTDLNLVEALNLISPSLLLHLDTVRRLLIAFMTRKLELQVMDFDDLILNVLRLFDAAPDVASRYAKQFEQVLVDEFQDAAPLQCAFVDRLASCHRNLMVVGDDCQSIYGFRGVDPKHLSRFKHRYPDAREVHLTVNYRSSPEILELAAASIRLAEGQGAKCFEPIALPGDRPRLLKCLDDKEQALFVAQRCLQAREDGHQWSDCAILYRTHWQARAIEQAFADHGIPYQVRSGVTLLEQPHVKDLLAYLKWTLFPLDRFSLRRCVGRIDGVGPKTLDKLEACLSTASAPLEVLFSERAARLIPRGAQPAFRALTQLLATMRTLVSEGDSEGALALALGHYEPWCRERYKGADERVGVLTSLVGWVGSFDAPEQLLQELALMRDARTVTVGSDVDSSAGAVRLSSIHQSKGLEWPIVFVIGLSDERFPGLRVKTFEALEEERRLFHVAVTRAERALYLSWSARLPDNRGGWRWSHRSRFLDELMAFSATRGAPLIERVRVVSES